MAELDSVDQGFKMRPTISDSGGENKTIESMQFQVEKYRKEIELLKLKMQFKNQIKHYKEMLGERNNHRTVNF